MRNVGMTSWSTISLHQHQRGIASYVNVPFSKRPQRMWEKLVEWFRIVYTAEVPGGTMIVRIPYNEARDHLIIVILQIVGALIIIGYFTFFYKGGDNPCE